MNCKYTLGEQQRIFDAGVPVIERQTNKKVKITFQHFVGSNKAAHLLKGKFVRKKMSEETF